MDKTEQKKKQQKKEKQKKWTKYRKMEKKEMHRLLQTLASNRVTRIAITIWDYINEEFDDADFTLSQALEQSFIDE